MNGAKMGEGDRLKFGFEDLDVWRKSVDFADTVLSITEELSSRKKHYRLLEQLEAAATSVALNIAEGKGRYSQKEFRQFLYIARGSMYEAVTLLQIFQRRGWISREHYLALQGQAKEIINMMMGLAKSLTR